MSDLVERVAMTIAAAEIEYFGPRSSLVQCQSWALCPDCYRNAARAAIAVLRPALRAAALEEAARVADAKAITPDAACEIKARSIAAAIRAMILKEDE